MKKLQVDVWSDIACPWCYVGKRRLERALERFEHRDAVSVVWHSFELDPSAPRVRDAKVSYAARLASKYGTSVARAEDMIRKMTDVGREDGIEFRFDRAQSGNTFDAHRVLHLAHQRGVQNAVKERFMRAYMTEGVAIGDPSVLPGLAAEAGLDVDEVQGVLTTDTFAREVREDEQQAAEIGISGVPFFVFDRRYGVSGAQPVELLHEVLEKAWGEVEESREESASEGAVCGPEGCG